VTADAPVAKFLAKHGAGLHHICLRVPDIDAAIAQLKARGIRMIDETARPGAHGSRIAFIHPASACGLLVEIKESAHHEGTKGTKSRTHPDPSRDPS
jgi:methylmalonyl-CoA epimerase